MSAITEPSAENWRPIPGYDGYEASDHGRVRSVTRHVRGRHGLMAARGRVLHLRRDRQGRLRVDLRDRDGRRTQFVHRLVLLAFVGPCPDGAECCHADDDSSNNHLYNLRWDTHSANHHDLVRNGNHNMRRKTACPRGHRLQHPNLDPSETTRGRRTCLSCRRARAELGARCDVRSEEFRMVSDKIYHELMAAEPVRDSQPEATDG